MSVPRARIAAVDYYLPDQTLSNDELSRLFTEWPAEKILQKTGISMRHIAGPAECASDLGVQACHRLFSSQAIDPASIDFLLFCTQSPDYFLPTTACLMQDRLGLRTDIGALDFNLGCSGFVYGLGLAKGLVETGQARRILLVTAETYSKYIHESDKGTRTIFGDAAAATLIDSCDSDELFIGPFQYGTDGRGGDKLILKRGGFREPADDDVTIGEDALGNFCSPSFLYMNGPEIFRFTIDSVPDLVKSLLVSAGLDAAAIDHFVFHQANQFMLEFLRKKIGIPSSKFPIHLSSCGNTVSSTIPILLKEMASRGILKPGQTLMLVGFGVGYSWAAAIVRWSVDGPTDPRG